MKKLLRLSTLLIGLLPILDASPARAGISVSPLKQEVSLPPGEKAKLTITLSNNVRNETSAPQAVHIDIVDVQVSPDGSLTFPPPGKRPDSASKWLTLSDTEVTIDPGKAFPLEVDVHPPLSAAPGEYYSAVLVTLATRGRTDKGVVLQYRVATGIFVTVTGRTFSRQAKIAKTEFQWPDASTAATAPATLPASTQPAEQPEDTPKLVVLLENTGKARFDAAGKIVILDKDSRVAFRTALTSSRPSVFGGDSRLFEALLSKPLPPGKYLAKIEMDYQSGWSTAHRDLPFEILPAQAAAMARMTTRQHDDLGLIDASPDHISATVQAGGTRILALAISNVSDDALRCTASLGAAEPAFSPSWIALTAEPLAIPRSGRRAIELRIQVPPDAAPGKYSAAIVVDAALDNGTTRKLSIPMDLEIKSEKK